MKKHDELIQLSTLAAPKTLKMIVLAVIVVWLLPMAIFFISGSEEKSGQFGDTFGSVNSLFSAFAFVGVILTIALQSRELELQREELQLTRGELMKSAEAQRQSADALKIQSDSLLAAAKLNALNARIEAYHVQIRESTAAFEDRLVRYRDLAQRTAPDAVAERERLKSELDATGELLNQMRAHRDDLYSSIDAILSQLRADADKVVRPLSIGSK